ncbi:MAG: dTDP-4-dehydrorhamnose reductase [Cryobacterium sp.]|nr:dTDP-4-dehydrorhamnose reductase [Cryobacterium sp.]MBX3116217.1 dTDP-4-dehydrorhamnose reductase [Cryobacterium sp.]
MLGRDLQEVFDGARVTALGRSELDITDPSAVNSAVASHDVVINCAAFTKVDDAESREPEAFAINATGAANLARAAAAESARLIQVSTDYVFNGRAASPYSEDSPRNPVSAYGRTKAEGERLALELNPGRTLIVRTAWLFGAHGPNFVKTMLRLAAERESLTVVDDQVGQPTWTRDVALQIKRLIEADVAKGIYHATSSGRTSWFGFARAIFELAGLDPKRISPISSAEFVRPAPRPAFSVLGHDAWAKAGIPPIGDWAERLREAAEAGVLSAEIAP